MPERKKRKSPNVVDEYFGEIEEWAEQMDETLAQKPSWSLKDCTMEPLREINMTATEVIVTVDLPLTQESAVQVRPTDNSLEISAKMRRKLHLHELGISYHRGEIQKFQCHIRIPVPVNMDKMSIKYKKGMLEVHMPRKR
jgi:HSP20 family molecular chaperone IbpA